MTNNSGSPRIAMTLLFITLVFSPWSNVGAEDGSADKAIHQSLDQGIVAFNNENLSGALQSVHPDSPTYQVTKEQISRIFNNYDVKLELVDFEFVGESGPYAFVHVKEKSTKLSDTDFRNNTTDVVYIFRKHNNQWKLWGESVLETAFEDE